MDQNTRGIINKPRRAYRLAFIVCVFIILAAIIVAESDLDGKGGKYALVFILGFFALAALVTALLFIPRARQFEQLVSQLNPLAHWRYSENEWELFLEESRKEMLIVNKATLRWVTRIALVIGIILLLLSRDSLFILIISGIILMLSLAAILGPLVQTALMKREVREAYIGEHSVFIGGSFYTWTQLGAHLTGTGIYNENAAIPMLHIIYEFPTIRAFQQEIIRIPVPAGNLEEAEMVVNKLNEQI